MFHNKKVGSFLLTVLCGLVVLVILQLFITSSSYGHNYFKPLIQERTALPHPDHTRDAILQLDNTFSNASLSHKDIRLTKSRDHNNIIGDFSIRVKNETHRALLHTLVDVNNSRTNNKTQVNGLDLDAGKKQKKTVFKEIFHSGFGLESYVTEKGEKGWLENGVIYRPIPTSNSSQEKYPSPRITDYEPYLPFNETLFFPDPAHRSTSLTPKKIILWYTTARYTPPMNQPTPLRFCPEFPCLVTTNKSYAKQSAAMVFNGQRVKDNPPPRASQDQIFLFHNQEPETVRFFRRSNFSKPSWRSVFNWTMSYRTDSTIPAFYGLVRKHPNPPTKDYTAILSKKKRTAAWLVSHCGAPSKRDKYVAELKKYIDVDVYGKCGKLKCERYKDEECSEMITESYKFYLSFENAICKDYISEKFFRYMPLDIVTVARGSNEFHQHAPSGTFINTADFESPRRLAEYIVFLDKNDEEYIKILREKDQYMYLYEDFPIRSPNGFIKYMHYHYESIPFCRVCQKLWNLESNRHEIKDIQKWFGKHRCEEPKDINF